MADFSDEDADGHVCKHGADVSDAEEISEVEKEPVKSKASPGRKAGGFLPLLIDSHSHVTDDSKVIRKLPLLRLDTIVLVSCTPKDWKLILDVEAEWRKVKERATSAQTRAGLPATSSTEIILGFGVHPWHVYKPRAADWLDSQRKLLAAHPRSIVAETGLDKVAKSPKHNKVLWDEQMAVFLAQFDLAVELSRPVSLHCVHAFGPVHDLFMARAKESPPRFPPVVIMHSYSGTAGSVTSLIKTKAIGTRIYFGFSYVINVRGEAPTVKLIQAIQAVPENRIMLESDHISIDQSQADLEEILAVVANARGWTLEHTAAVTTANSKRALEGKV